MKRLLASLICIAGLSVAQAGALQISLEDILLLTERGVSDETVLVFLETREIGFIPDAEDIDKLLAAAVSEEVIRYILRQTATYSAPSYSYRTTTYVDLYPPYYYTPYYSGTSVFLGFSSFPHAWFGSHHGGVHHASLHHGAVHHLGHKDHGALSHAIHRGGRVGVHASRHGLGHNVATGIRHGGARSTGRIAKHSVGVIGRHTGNKHSVRHSMGRTRHVGGKNVIHRGRHKAAHGGRHSVGHSTRSTAHRGGHSRGGHSGGHSSRSTVHRGGLSRGHIGGHSSRSTVHRGGLSRGHIGGHRGRH